jgi:hypothetical protein
MVRGFPPFTSKEIKQNDLTSRSQRINIPTIKVSLWLKTIQLKAIGMAF